MSALEKFLMKTAGAAGKGIGAAKWAAKEHPIATGIAGGGAALGAGAGIADALEDDDSLEGLLSRGKKKVGGLMDDAGEGIEGLLARLGLK